VADRIIGASIKQHMLNNGISQAFISSKTNIPANTLNAILNSKRNLLAEEYFLICEALAVPLQTFKNLNNEKRAS
jgi:transcriptional regulator with XRE-family HTH domain